MADTKPVAIVLSQVKKSFGHKDTLIEVLHGIDLTLYTGELSLIVGPSGCGKTTLISIITGVLEATSGDVVIFDKNLSTSSDKEKTRFRKDNVGFIFQQFNLIPTLTATENVAVPLFIRGEKRDAALEKSRKILDMVGLGDRLDFLPRDLSGGQQQRIAIARALIVEPRLVVCDEPTAALDAGTGQKIMGLLKNLADTPGRCVVVVTHDNRIFQYGDRVVEMNDGRIGQVYLSQHNQEHLA